MKERLNKINMFVFVIVSSLVFNYNCIDTLVDFKEPENQIYRWQIEPEFSNDGERIVFNGLYDSVEAIHFIDKNGNYLGCIMENQQYFLSSPSWGPDTNKIAVSINGNIFLVNIKGDSLYQLTLSGQDFSPSWSKDGKYIAYTKSICDPDCGVAVYYLTSNTKRVIGQYGGYASWNESSDKIYYYHTLYEKRPDSHISDYKGFVFKRIDVNTLKIDSLFHVEPTEAHLWLTDCTISPDENEILFAASEGAPPQIYIWKINLKNNSFYKMTVGDHPSFSPDGSKIVYTNTIESEGGLWIMDSDGSDKRRLTKFNK
jgi:Tol biopolymer transport system component